MKGNESHTVFLSDRALELLEAQRGLHVRWVFPSPAGHGKPLSNGGLLQLLRRMRMNDATTSHGLRATFSTWAYETGASRTEVIEACLAHREANFVKAAYNRATFATERRALLAAWADFIDGKQAPSNVVMLPERQAA
jgi:integrase